MNDTITESDVYAIWSYDGKRLTFEYRCNQEGTHGVEIIVCNPMEAHKHINRLFRAHGITKQRMEWRWPFSNANTGISLIKGNQT